MSIPILKKSCIFFRLHDVRSLYTENFFYEHGRRQISYQPVSRAAILPQMNRDLCQPVSKAAPTFLRLFLQLRNPASLIRERRDFSFPFFIVDSFHPTAA